MWLLRPLRSSFKYFMMQDLMEQFNLKQVKEL